MATEGIMSLPAGLSMQGEEQAQQTPPSVTSADSYDAAQTAMGLVDPSAQAAAKQAIREAIGDLQLKPEQLDLLIQIFEYVSQNPTDYQNLVQKMEEAGVIDKGEFPPEYDPQFVGMVLMVLQEMRSMQSQGAQEPMDIGPVVEGLQPMGMARGGLADVASYLASQGRGGDTMLAHITPEEAAMLKRRGGSGTINPITGLPEFKGGVLGGIVDAVKGVVKGVVGVVKKALQSPVGRILGTIALATVLGPAGVGLSMGTAAGLAGAGTTLLAGGSIKEALVSGAMGYIGGGGTIMGASPVAAVGQYLPGAAGGALNTGLTTGLIGAGVGKIAGMSTQDALRMGLMSGASAAALQGLRNNTNIFNKGVTEADLARGAQAETGAGAAPVDQGIGGLRTSAEMTGAGAPGPIGTAQDMLAGSQQPFQGQGLNMQYGMGEGLKSPFGTGPSYMGEGEFATGLQGTADTTNYSLTPRNFNPLGRAGLVDYPSSGAQGLAPSTGMVQQNVLDATRAASPNPYAFSTGMEPSITPAVAGGGTPAGGTSTGFMDRMISGTKNLYNEYLSPSRPGLPADAGFFRKYGPMMAAGTAVVGAAGGFKSTPSDPNPLFQRDYTGTDYLRDNPDKFRGGLDFSYVKPTTPQSPVVQTNFGGAIPIGQPGQIVPMGATMSPQGVSQPYNVAGLYGVPLIYPVNRAKGGEMTMTEFPRKTGPINGPGTGTSDSIPAMLSDGEFVFTAKAVRNAGGGSRRKGAARMYKLMKKLEGGPVKG